MFIRGRHKLLVALWALLGACVGTAAGQSPLGPRASYPTGIATTTAGPTTEGVPPAASPGPDSPPQGTLPPAGYPPHGPVMGPPGPMMPGAEGPPHAPGPFPVELTPTSHPPYTVAPPDILYIDTLRLIPCGPYRLEPLDQLQVIVTPTLPNQPIAGIYIVSPEGVVNLGFAYGAVRIVGLTVEQAQEMIRRHLGGTLRDPQVSVAILQYRGVQQTRGEHLVRPDGTISLGTYGSVYVAGLTLGQVKCVVENYLAKFFTNPQVSVDVAAYNSKFYYVITDGGGYGQQILKFPVTGNEYVLDAITNIGGLSPVSSKRKIWVARPAPCNHPCFQILPVDWRAITEGGQTCTNYQLFPGDRVYIRADALICLDNWLSKILAPIERLFGITLLGSSAVRSVSGNFGNNGTGFGFVTVP